MTTFEIQFKTQGDIRDCGDFLDKHNIAYDCPSLKSFQRIKTIRRQSPTEGLYFTILIYDEDDAMFFKLSFIDGDRASIVSGGHSN